MAFSDVDPITASGSTNGRMIAVAATSSPGTTLHTAHSTHVDGITIYASNIDTVPRNLTIELGGTSASDQILLTLQAGRGLYLVCENVRLTGGVAVKAFADLTNKINCYVRVNRFATS